MSVRVLLCYAILFLAATEIKMERISFWQGRVTLTCPASGNWFDRNNNNIGQGPTYEFDYSSKKKGPYHCNYDDDNNNNKRYNFYVQGKVCENCFELDGSLWAAAIFGDMSLTMVVMVIIYKCAKKRSSAGLPHTPKGGAPPGGHAQPVPSSNYEQLNPQTLSQGTYSEVHSKRAG